MSDWSELARLGLTVRPFTGEKPPAGNRSSLFSASLTATVRQLAKELRALDAERVALELDVRERDIRVDGLPRADARPSHPAVSLSFESRHGPLRYATCEFTSWQDNLRAIALSMEALRAVDRYGVSKRGEQYQGWKALPASSDPADQVRTREQAESILASYGGLNAALKATHPDKGGDPDDFRRVMRARELVGA